MVLKNKILIVDDQELNIEVTKSIIERGLRDVIFCQAFNGEEAIESFKKEKPHFVLMDLQMPIIDGFSAVKAIKQIDPQIPIVAYTSQESKESKEKAHVAGIDHYITKPVSQNVLIRTITKWLINNHSFNFTASDISKILKNKRIISADDQVINNKILSKDLEGKFDMKIDEVIDGSELVRKFKEEFQKGTPYDAVITDIYMDPGMSGIDAAKEIREYEMDHKIKYKTPIVAITGDTDKDLVYRLFRSGIDDCFGKGHSQKLLHNIMAFWIQERGNRRDQKELLTMRHFSPKTDDSVECEYYDNDYDNINLLSDRIDKKELLEMTDLFIKNSTDLVSQIIVSYENNNVKDFGVHVHSLKGVAGNMGLERLYRFSHNLNEASKEIDVITEDCIEKLKDVFEESKVALGYVHPTVSI